jgi:hypothetical protein
MFGSRNGRERDARPWNLRRAAALVPTHSLNHSYLRLLRDLPRQWWKDPTNANADDLLAKDPNAFGFVNQSSTRLRWPQLGIGTDMVLTLELFDLVSW